MSTTSRITQSWVLIYNRMTGSDEGAAQVADQFHQAIRATAPFLLYQPEVLEGLFVAYARASLRGTSEATLLNSLQWWVKNVLTLSVPSALNNLSPDFIKDNVVHLFGSKR